MPFKAFLIILCCFLIDSVKSQEDTVYNNVYYNYVITNNRGELVELGNCDGHLKVGAWMYFFSNGKVAEEGYYLNNLPHRTWMYYHSDGSELATGKYILGVKHGKWTYFPTCKVKYEYGNIIKEKCEDYKPVYYRE